MFVFSSRTSSDARREKAEWLRDKYAVFVQPRRAQSILLLFLASSLHYIAARVSWSRLICLLSTASTSCPGLCDGVLTGAEALAGFPSLHTLPHTAVLGFHGVNVHGSESRNKSMVVHIKNPYDIPRPELIAKEMIGKRTFIGWPFLQEGLVVAVSDSLFKYENMAVVPGSRRRSSQIHIHRTEWGIGRGRRSGLRRFTPRKLGVITG
jgi:5'-3' exonuclease